MELPARRGAARPGYLESGRRDPRADLRRASPIRPAPAIDQLLRQRRSSDQTHQEQFHQETQIIYYLSIVIFT